MNEEENQAIEFLKHSIFEYEEIDTSVMEYIDKNHKIIYKLILNQQKEIEQLDKKFQYAVPVDVINDLYISKDKIREFMKDYQEGDMLEITGVCKFLLGE